MASSGNTAKKIDEPEADEPSMDDILASIRQIISDDEDQTEDITERDQYSHPTDPSNSNTAAMDDSTLASPVLDSLDQEMEAAVAAELAVEEPAPTKPPFADQLAAKAQDIQSKADEVRAEIGTAGAVAGGLTLEQRLQQFRDKTKGLADQGAASARGEALKKNVAMSVTAQAAAPTASRSISGVVPTLSAPTADDVAKALLDSQSGDMNRQLEDMMRPAVNEWLADNLPGLVERLVREEIERVSRGRKSA